MRQLKSSITFVYASYALTSFFSRTLPRIIPRKFLDTATRNFTLAYSNTPGPIKPLYYLTRDQIKISSVWSSSFVMIAGYVGLSVACLSFDSSFMITVSADTAIWSKEDCDRMIKYIQDNINSEMQRTIELEKNDNSTNASAESKKDK